MKNASSAQQIEWDRDDLRRAQANLRDAKARVRTSRNRLAREAIDAELCPADAEWYYNIAVAPGDEPIAR